MGKGVSSNAAPFFYPERKSIMKFTKEQLKAIPVYITPNEKNGSVLSIPTIDLTGEEFTQLRLTHNGGIVIGASAVSPMVNQEEDPYGRTPVSTYEEQVNGKKEEDSPIQKRIYQLGHDWEPVGATAFCKRYGLILYRPSGMLYCATEPGITANIDFIGVDPNTGEPCIIEMKNVNGAEHKKKVRRWYSEGVLPDTQYVLQTDLQRYVSGINKVFIVYCWAESPWGFANYEVEELYYFDIPCNPERITQVVEGARVYLEALKSREPQKLLDLPGATQKDYTLLYGEGEGELLADQTQTSEWLDACDEFVRASRSEECAKAERENAEKELRRLLGKNKKAYVHTDLMDVEITTKTRESKTWDTEKLQQLAPDVYEEGLSFSITESKLKKLENKDAILSCLTVKTTPVAGIKVKVEER